MLDSFVETSGEASLQFFCGDKGARTPNPPDRYWDALAT